MKIESSLTDQAMLEELGERLAHRRVALALTQAQAAEQAGVSKRTLERLEAGDAVQTPNLVRVLRVLDLVAALDALVPPVQAGPMAALRRGGKPRQRAPRSDRRAATGEPWRWDDEA